MMSALDYITELQARGRFSFTTNEAVEAMGSSLTAVRASLRRLKQKELIASPYRGFHVVLPPAYRRLGCLPADRFIPHLMVHLGEPYYVGLLSAAMYHGAAHQTPMVFQVIVPKARRGLSTGGIRVEFIARLNMVETPVNLRNTETGVIRIATPEATALELVGYPERSGYLNNVATVLTELAESITGEALALEARRAPMAWVQRLGFLLVLVGADELANHLDTVLRERETFTVGLAAWKPIVGAPRDPRWQLAVNIEVESDL